MTTAIRRKAERMGRTSRSKPSSSRASEPKKAAPIRVASSSAVKGPSGPWRRSASRATSMSRAIQPPRSSRTATPISALEHPDIAGLQVVLEEVAGLLVALPQRHALGVHLGLAGQALLVLHREQGHDEP